MSKMPFQNPLSNLKLIEELYASYLKDPQTVDVSWRHFFEGIDFGMSLAQKGISKKFDETHFRIYDLVQAFRRYGHLLSSNNPLEDPPQSVKELELERLSFSEEELDELFPTLGFFQEEMAPLKQILEKLKNVYSGRIGFEETLLPSARIKEEIAIALRLKKGILKTDFSWPEETLKALKSFKDLKFIEESQTHFALTEKGMLYYDSIASEIIELPSNPKKAST